MSCHVVLYSVAGEELHSWHSMEMTGAWEVKLMVAQRLGLPPYAFQLITQQGLLVSDLRPGRTELTLVKFGVPSPDARGYVQLSSSQVPQEAGRNLRLPALSVALVLVCLRCRKMLRRYLRKHLRSVLLVSYLSYLLEGLFFNRTARGLLALGRTESILEYIEKIKACRPAPERKAQCYHMVTRVQNILNDDGTLHTETYEERVDTARITEELLVRRWEDVTGPVVDGLRYFFVFQVHFDITWEAADEATVQHHERQREALSARAEAADDSHETRDTLRLIDSSGEECRFQSDMIGVTDRRPWLGYAPYALCCLFGLGWLYRLHVSRVAVKGELTFRKKVWSHAEGA